MGKRAYIGAQGTAQQTHKIYVGDGVAHRAKKAYMGDENGIARLVFMDGGKAWAKYSCEVSFEYIRDDAYVGQVSLYSTPHGVGVPIAWEFDPRSGFYYTHVENREPDNLAGTYVISDTGVDVLTELLRTEEYMTRLYYVYAVERVASASPGDDIYSKGSTFYGTIYKDEGEQPEMGDVLEQGANYYVIQTTDGSRYWYQLIEEE